MRAWLKSLLDADNRELDTLILLAFIGMGAITIYSGLNLFFGDRTFDPQAYGLGFASIIGALGLGKAARDWKQGGPTQ